MNKRLGYIVGLVVGLGFFISVCVIIFIVRQNPSVNLNIKIMTKISLMALAKNIDIVHESIDKECMFIKLNNCFVKFLVDKNTFPKRNYVSIADDHIADIGIACAGNNLFNPVRP